MARKMYKRLTWPVFDEHGDVVHDSGELIAADAPLDPAARYEDVEVEVPDPEPEPEPPPAVPSDAPPKSGRRHATVQAQPAQGGGQAHP